MNTIVGDGEIVPWPAYTSRLDVEPELAVSGRVKYQGSTSEISHKAEDVFAWLRFIGPLKPGSGMGFGTIPECTGGDRDDFIDPGAEIEITASASHRFLASARSARIMRATLVVCVKGKTRAVCGFVPRYARNRWAKPCCM